MIDSVATPRWPAGEGRLAAGDGVTAFDPLSSEALFNALAGDLEAGRATPDALRCERNAALAYANAVGRV